MGYSIGIDGGGTKTDCLVLADDGSVIGEGRGGPSNPLRSGFDEAFRSIGEASAEALKSARLRPGDITSVCVGLAGAGRRSVIRRVMVFLGREFPRATAQVTTDYEIALETAAGTGPGIVLISGTGSVAYGRNAAGETARSGGYGPWIGDEGSAFEIGRRAGAAVARARDLDAPVTLLAEMIPTVLNCPDWDDLMQRIMKNPDEVFPHLFTAVAEAANSEDSTAKEILFTAAIGLGNLAMIVVRRLEMKDQEFPLVKCGGVFGHSRMLDALLDSVLASGAMRARISRLEISPALGAARIAARLAESPVASQRPWRLNIPSGVLAVRPMSSESIAELLASTSEEILSELIENPSLDETHLCLLLERKDLTGLLVEKISKRKKWQASYRVRRLLAFHPHTPRNIAMRLLRDLHLMDLVRISLLPTSTGELRRLAEDSVLAKILQLPLGQRLMLAKRGSSLELRRA